MSKKTIAKDITLVIPMSGIGRRFQEAGYEKPKPLIEVDKGKSMIEYVVRMFDGVGRVIFICNERHLSNTDMRSVLNACAPGCTILQTPDGVRSGPVDAVLSVADSIPLDSEVIVSYCDYGTVWDFGGFLSDVDDRGLDGSIACYRGFHPHMLGTDNYAFCRHQDDMLLEIKEKQPFTDDRMSEWASNGTYHFRSGDIMLRYFRELVDLGISIRGEYYVSMVYNLMVRDGLRVGIYGIDKMLQWGTPHDLEVYQRWSRYFSAKGKGQPRPTNPAGTTLVLPMAGQGSRFAERGYSTHKPFLPVDGAPMVVAAVKCLPKSDRQVFVCRGEHLDLAGEILEAHFPGSQVCSVEGTTEGQACTCEVGIHELDLDPGSPIMISACDNGASYDPVGLQALLDDESVDVVVWSFRNNPTSKHKPNMYSWLDVDEGMGVRRVHCKSFPFEDPMRSHAIIGTMFFRECRHFLDGLRANYEAGHRTNGEFYVDDVINRCVESGLRVKAFEVTDYICWGTPDDYMTYNYWKDHFEKNRQ
jgi:dTDP-glucose pyrophosphorylase